MHYSCEFIIIQRKCPNDYKDWLVSMYAIFGTKWVNLFCGPMWSIQSIAQGDVQDIGNSRCPSKVHVLCVSGDVKLIKLLNSGPCKCAWSFS